MDAPEALPRTWMSRLADVFQPLSVRADRLEAMPLFAGLERPWLELAAALVVEASVARGMRLTVQGSPPARVWIILEGQALVTADARPVRVAGGGDVIGLTSMLLGRPAAETTLALTAIRAFELEPSRFAELLNAAPIRSRLAAAATTTSATRKSARRRSSAGG